MYENKYRRMRSFPIGSTEALISRAAHALPPLGPTMQPMLKFVALAPVDSARRSRAILGPKLDTFLSGP